MSIFISYSHADKDFVERLATNLVRRKTRVWVDSWELKIGDSLIDRIQAAVDDATALIVVLSRASVKSEWCKQELSSGLVRELEEKRVVVLPVVIDNCNIPLFLRRKLYADFRKGFDKGIETILEAIAGVTSDTQSRSIKRHSLVDSAVDVGTSNGVPVLRLIMVEHGNKIPYCILTEVHITLGPQAWEFYAACAQADLDWYGRQTIIDGLADFTENNQLQFILDDNRPQRRRFPMFDSRGLAYSVTVSTRWLGEDTGKRVFVDW